MRDGLTIRPTYAHGGSASRICDQTGRRARYFSCSACQAVNSLLTGSLASPAGASTLIGVDTSYAYTLEAGMSVQRYDRRMDMKEMVVASTLGVGTTFTFDLPR